MAAPNQDSDGENPDGSSYDMTPGSSGDNDGDGDKGGEPWYGWSRWKYVGGALSLY